MRTVYRLRERITELLEATGDEPDVIADVLVIEIGDDADDLRLALKLTLDRYVADIAQTIELDRALTENPVGPMPTNGNREIAARIASHVSWANTTNRTERTAPARAGLDARFLREADGDPQRAASLKKAHFQRMALASIKVRRAKAAARIIAANDDN